MPGEVFSRRQLPHWYVPGAWHFITYRLAGSIPVDVQRDWRFEREQALAAARARGAARGEMERLQKRFFAKYDEFLDHHRDVAYLAQPDIATMICENLHHHDGTNYRLAAYSAMPNHVHVLLQPLEPIAQSAERIQLSDEFSDGSSPLSAIMHSLKSYTAHEANKMLGRHGPFWQSESYDHWARDDDEAERIVLYINTNAVKAGLIERPHLWPYGSARLRFEQDGFESGALLLQ